MYKLINFPDGTESDMILRKDDSTYIPKIVGNKDYDEYLEWVADGNTPEEAE
jgi:hypothetical protein